MSLDKKQDVQDAAAQIKGCFDRDALLEVLLDFAATRLDAAWMGLISGDKLLMMRGVGRWASVSERLVLLNDAMLRALCASAPSWNAASAKELKALRPLPTPRQELVILPIHIAGRAVLALGGVPRPGLKDLKQLQDLLDIGALVGHQLEQIILVAKSQKLAAQATQAALTTQAAPTPLPAPAPQPAPIKLVQVPSLAHVKKVKRDADDSAPLQAAPKPTTSPRIPIPTPAPLDAPIHQTILGGFDVYRPGGQAQEQLRLLGSTLQGGAFVTPNLSPGATLQGAPTLSRSPDPAPLGAPLNQTILGGFGFYRPAEASASLSQPVHTTLQSGAALLNAARPDPEPAPTPAPPTTPRAQILRGARKQRRAVDPSLLAQERHASRLDADSWAR